jgi:hypothetical protein
VVVGQAFGASIAGAATQHWWTLPVANGVQYTVVVTLVSGGNIAGPLKEGNCTTSTVYGAIVAPFPYTKARVMTANDNLLIQVLGPVTGTSVYKIVISSP